MVFDMMTKLRMFPISLGMMLCILQNVISKQSNSTVVSANKRSLRDTIELATSENPGSVAGTALSESQKEAVLQLHNAFRSMVKPTASNMLKMNWDKDLEKISTDFANKCIVAHNPDRHKLAKNFDWVGENIAWGTGTCGDKDCGDVYEGVKRWFSESKSYNFLTGQCSGKCTLYTQMVWWESNKLGCGAKRCGDRTILVCNYAPGGNYVGQRPYKSGKPCSECPGDMACEDNLCVEKKPDSEEVKEVVKPEEEDQHKDEAGIESRAPSIPVVVANQQSLGRPTKVLPLESCCHPDYRPPGPIVEPCCQDNPAAECCNNQHGECCHNNEPTECCPPNVDCCRGPLPPGWIELPIRLTQIDSGLTPSVWGMNGKHSLYMLGSDNNMIPVDGTMHHVSAGQAGVWAVGLLGNVFFRRGVSVANEKGLYWEKIPGNLKQIDSGPYNVVWGVNRYNRIFCRIGIQSETAFRRDGIPSARPEGTGWMRVEGSMKYVSCGELGCWAVNKRDNIYFRGGVTAAIPQGTHWTVVPGKLRMIESGPGGITVGLSDTSDLFVRAGVMPSKPDGSRWIKLDLKLAHVTVGTRGIMGILSDGTVAIHKDIESFISNEQPTIPPTEVVFATQNAPLDTITPPISTVPIALKGEAATTIKPDTIEGLTPTKPVNLADSLAALSQLSGASVAKLPSIISDREKLHITPDMAARILKLIEQKGNQFEEDHKAAAEATHNITTQEIEEIAQAIRQKSPEAETKATSQHQQRDNATVPKKESVGEEVKPPATNDKDGKAGSAQKIPSQTTQQSKPQDSILPAADALTSSQNPQASSPLAQNSSQPEPSNSPQPQSNSQSAPQLPSHLSFPHSQPGQSAQSPETQEVPPSKEVKHPKALSQLTPPAEKQPTQGTKPPPTHARTQGQHTQVHHTQGKAPVTKPTQLAKAVASKSNQPVATQQPQVTYANKVATVPPNIETQGAQLPPGQGGLSPPLENSPAVPGNPSVVVNKINADAPPPAPPGQPVAGNVPPPVQPAQSVSNVEAGFPAPVGEKHLQLGPTRIPTTIIHRLIRTTLFTRTRPVIVHVHTTPIVKEELDVLQKYPQPKLPLRPRTTPVPVAATGLRTVGPGLNTQTHKNWVHSVKPTVGLVTSPALGVKPQLRPTISAPHATVLPGSYSINGIQRDKNHLQNLMEKKEENVNVAFVQPPAPLAAVPATPAPHQSSAPEASPVTVSWELTRSCCAIPDSVCPIPKDCIGYIECHGYKGNYKSCERGKMFNPITNICDYPRNVDCESVKAGMSKNFNQKPTVTMPPGSTIIPPTAQALPQPQASAVNVVPHLVQDDQHTTGTQRGSSKPKGKSHDPAQPRLKPPHTEDDGVLREVWFGLGLSPLLTLLTNNPRFPTSPDEYIVLDKFEAPPNAGDGYGQRLSTYYKAPQTGEYTFYMSCDNECELWISPDTEEIHSNLILELKHGHYTSFRQWHKYPEEQTSRPIYLQEGEYYFMESFMKEGAGGDDLSIGVKLPNGEFDLPISKNLYLVPGDAASDANVRKPGQPVQAAQYQQKVVQAPTPEVQVEAQPALPTEGAEKVAPVQVALPQQPSAPVYPQFPMNPQLMGPQPGQTAEQWIAANNERPRVQTFGGGNYRNPMLASFRNSPGNIPGAEIYMHHAREKDTVEKNNRILITSVKRNKIPQRHTNTSAIK